MGDGLILYLSEGAKLSEVSRIMSQAERTANAKVQSQDLNMVLACARACISEEDHGS